MSAIDCPICGTENSDLNPRCASCGALLPDVSGAVHSPSPAVTGEPANAATARSGGADLPRTAPASRGRVDPGTKLGRFVVVDHLGEGGMGLVVSARDPALDRTVALKLLRPGVLGNTEKTRARLVREAQAMARVAHPNVVTVHEVGVHEDQVFMVMERVDGQTLRAWLREERRPWREVLDRFLRAGRGLSAAHRAGLVHRDFKPDNVLVSKDGRVLVTDFGLVGEPASDAVAKADPDGEAAARSLSPLTSAGAVLGTPAYMSPEQLDQRPCDARTDQFAFAVSLYEGLHGERPFSGETLSEIRASVLGGRVREAPRGTAVPSFLRAALLRALEVDPERRHPSMAALLDALERDPAAGRRRALRIGILAALAALAGLALLRRPFGRAELCTGGEQRLSGVWDPAVKQAVHDAMLATGKPYADEAYERVEAEMDRRSRAWTAMYRDSCEATHVRGDQSAQLLDLRTQCLDRRIHEMSALASLLSRGVDVGVLDRAPSAALSLSDLAVCADGAALSAAVPLPEDAALRTAVLSLRARIDETETARSAGKSKELTGPAQEIATTARGLPYAPIQAEALTLLARVQRDVADVQGAESTCREAIPIAAKSRDEVLTAKLWSSLVYVVGVDQGRHADALALRLAAESAAERAGTDTAAAGQVYNSIGLVLYKKGDFEQARPWLERALAIFEKIGDDLSTAAALNSLANLEDELDHPAETLKHHTRALAIREKRLGPEHPLVAITLNNMGTTLQWLGKHEEALIHFRRAISIWEKALGPEHPNIAAAVSNMANTMSIMHRLDEAQALHERALAIRSKAFGPEHATVGNSLHNLGTVLDARGQLAQARDYFERAVAVREKALGPEHQDVASSLSLLGRVLCRERKFGDGRARHERAIAIYEKAVGAQASALVRPLRRLGECWMDARDFKRAQQPLERAFAIATAKKDAVEPAMLAEAGFALAQALWDGNGDRARAASLAEGARDAFAKGGAEHQQDRAEVEAWIAKHPRG